MDSMETVMSIVARWGNMFLRLVEYIVSLIFIAFILAFLGMLAVFNMMFGD